MSRFRFRIWDKENLEMYDEAIVGNFPKTVPMVLVGGDWLHIEPKVCEVMQCTGIKDIDKHTSIIVKIFIEIICSSVYIN